MGMFNDLHELDLAQQQAPPTRPPKPQRKAAATVERAPSTSAEVATPPPDDARTTQDQPPQQTNAPVTEAAGLELDWSEPPYRKATFLVTDAEFEALEDLKLGVRRALDLKVTKEELARCAIVHLVRDFQAHGADSPVLAPFKRRRGR